MKKLLKSRYELLKLTKKFTDLRSEIDKHDILYNNEIFINTTDLQTMNCLNLIVL